MPSQDGELHIRMHLLLSLATGSNGTENARVHFYTRARIALCTTKQNNCIEYSRGSDRRYRLSKFQNRKYIEKHRETAQERKNFKFGVGPIQKHTIYIQGQMCTKTIVGYAHHFLQIIATLSFTLASHRSSYHRLSPLSSYSCDAFRDN